MIGALLARLGLPVLLEAVRYGLEKIDNPSAKGAAEAIGDAQQAIATGGIRDSQLNEAHRHLEAMEHLDSLDWRVAMSEINRTIRAEVASSDAYVRRMRPTFGYIIAVTWAAQMGAIAFAIIEDPAEAGLVIQAMASLGTIWTVGLSVLGIYVYKRSQEKSLGFQLPEPDALSTLRRVVTGNRQESSR